MTIALAHEIDGPPDAAPLVLLNSVGTPRAIWAAPTRSLAGRFRVIRMDARGHGESAPTPPDAPLSIADLGRDVLAVLDSLGVEQVDLAGISLGGMTAMWLAAHHPHRVRRLVLVCTSAHPGRPDSWRERADTVRADGMAAVADAVVARWLTADRRARDPELTAYLRGLLVSTDAETYAQCCEVLAELDLRADLAQIVAPTLVIAGDQDEALPPAHSDQIAALIPAAVRVDISPAAHIPAVEQPDQLAGLIARHLGAPATVEEGRRSRRAVLGDAHVDRAAVATTPFTADFQDFLTRYAWGDVWSRPGLAPRDRSIATLAALVALGAENELAMHVRAAVRNGLTRAQIAEVLLHTALYAGLPRANAAFAVAQRVLDELDAEPPSG